MVRLLTARGKYADAAPHFVRSYELQPGWRAADFAGFAYQHLGDLSQAEHWYTTALQQDASVGVVYFGLAQIRLQQHQPLQAIPYLKKALELEPTADGFHYELGNALEQTSNLPTQLRSTKQSCNCILTRLAHKRRWIGCGCWHQTGSLNTIVGRLKAGSFPQDLRAMAFLGWNNRVPSLTGIVSNSPHFGSSPDKIGLKMRLKFDEC